MKKIKLTTREELNIYMSPVRQQLLRELSISKDPMTPKALSDKLKISASSVQHHIKKLMSLGLIELDHIALINGIRASFYRRAQVLVQIGLDRSDDLSLQRFALMQDSIAQVYDGFCKQMKKRTSLQGNNDLKSMWKWGDILTGVAHLNEQESDVLMKLIVSFLEQHSRPITGSTPWEYAIIAYKAGDICDG
ncbi:MAG TPA: helix-turn-helix domain-containing protein [Clostridiales bacterium]|nr:helix-turn-helix domain-containing protein [Clostridiales bacterium]